MKPTILSILVFATVPWVARPAPTGLGAQATGVTETTAPRIPEDADYLLPAGKIEVSGLFGGNVHTGAQEIHPSVGGKAVLGLAQGVGVFGEGSWHRVFSLNGPGADAGASAFSTGGGLQWTPFRLARFAPYMQAGLGWVRTSAGGHVGPYELHGSTDRLGANIGFGARVYLTRKYGVILEVGALQGTGNSWIARLSTGLFYQFK